MSKNKNRFVRPGAKVVALDHSTQPGVSLSKAKMAVQPNNAWNQNILDKLDRITNPQAAIILILLGVTTFMWGLTGPFEGDDFQQIVNNVLVHSLKNIPSLFLGGTFYDGLGRLAGYYRPLMMAVFSVLYAVFGAHPFFFHVVQLALVISSAFILFLFLRYTFRPFLALALSLIFLIHPINSQVVYAIPSMQDALFFFFGILAIWLLCRFASVKGLFGVALCLCLSLLSKESGVLFMSVALVYLFIFNSRKRLYTFIGIMILPLASYILLRWHAVGIQTGAAPIASLSFGERLLMVPSVVLLYISKLFIPAHLARGYFSTVYTIDFLHFVLPFILELCLSAVLVYLGFLIRKRATLSQYYTYIFFLIWLVIGLLSALPLIPLDMTACETWLYFPLVGLLGMVGLIWKVFGQQYVRPRHLLVACAIITILLGIRSATRGLDWASGEFSLASQDFRTTGASDYGANKNMALAFALKGQFGEARPYIVRSVNLYPTLSNCILEGTILSNLGDYNSSLSAYKEAATLGSSNDLYENMAELTLLTGSYGENRQWIERILTTYPNDKDIWLYLALLDSRYGNIWAAQVDIKHASSLGPVDPVVFKGIMNGMPFVYNLVNTRAALQVKWPLTAAVN